MTDFFKTQSLFTLVADTKYSGISGATVKRILYTKPSGKIGFFDAYVANSTELRYDMQNNDIDEDGDWTFQAYVEIGGLRGYGNKFRHPFLIPIS